MNKETTKYLKVLVIVLFCSANVNSLVAIEGNGVSLVKRNNPKAEKLLAWDIDDLTSSNNTIVASYTNHINADSNVYHALLSSSDITLVDLNTNKSLGFWVIRQPSICLENDSDCIEPWYSGRWGNQEFVEQQLSNFYDNSSIGQFYLPLDEQQLLSHGCLARYPLRYGDIDEDNQKELILWLADTLAIFSPVTNKLIFAALIARTDMMSAEETTENLKVNNEESPQFASLFHYNLPYTSGIEPAMRAYAKVYSDDFNANGKHDLLVWRKFYRSKARSDSAAGFDKISDTYVHYTLVDSEYKLQSTDQATIQNWLADKNLTWQKGFPTISECAGQEGQLIPEMHDPLLNDPDVLQ